MPEYSGTLQSFDLAALLWLAPLFPLVAAVYSVVVGRQLAEGSRSGSEQRAPAPVLVALVACAASVVLIGFHAAELFSLPPASRQLLAHAWTVFAVGSLDSSIGFCLDPANAVLALGLGVAAVGALFALHAGDGSDETKRRQAAAIALGLCALELVTLGDDWLLIVLGAALSGVAALGFAGANFGARGFLLARLGDAAIFGGAIVLAWGLGGSFTGHEDYVPRFRPPLIRVELGSPKADKDGETAAPPGSGSGWLTLSAYPGATLKVAGADLCAIDSDGKIGGVGTPGRACKEIARSPFARLALPSGLTDVEVHPGAGMNDFLLDKLRINAGKEVLITPSGTTLSLRDARAELGVRDSEGEHVLVAELERWRFHGLPLFELSVALLALGAVIRSLLAPLSRASRASAETTPLAAVLLAGVLDFTVGAVILARADFLLAYAPYASAALGVVSALLALYAAARAAHANDLSSALSNLAVSGLAFAMLAAAFGARVGAVAMIAVQALGLVAFGLSASHASGKLGTGLAETAGAGLAKPGLARASALGALALAGAPLPAVGAFWPRDAGLQNAANAVAFGPFTGWLVYGVAALAGGIGAFAVWRVHHLVFSGEKNKAAKSKPTEPNVPLQGVLSALGVLALVAGVVALLESRFGPVENNGPEPLEANVRLALLAAGYALAVAGFVLARRRYGATRDEDWVGEEVRRPGHRLLAREGLQLFDVVFVRPALALARWLRGLDAALEIAAFGAVEGLPVVKSPSEPPPSEPPPKKKKKKKKSGGTP
jgi:NADH:ubiquinone oxidoreductase subunit 5 (subunit L)/multisubunit Na+/H+ antiporter MnhA subunit